jgi:hypothetical protein
MAHVSDLSGNAPFPPDAQRAKDTKTALAKATAAAPSYTEGDHQPLSQNLSGSLRTVTTIAAGAAEKVDDAAFTPATTSVIMAGFEFDDTTPDSVDEGDAGAARMSARRELYTQLRDAAGNERGANVNASNQLAVAGPVTNAGTFVVQVDGAALTSLQLIDDAVKTDDAGFTPATDKVLMIGAQADETSADSVDEGDAGALRMTLDRQLRVASEIQSTTIDDYETVAASQTAQALGATGATGDFISHILVVPATTSPGNVLLLDNATSITVFTGGASSVSNLVPFTIPIGAKSVSGAWKITTGANVSCVGVGKFT